VRLAEKNPNNFIDKKIKNIPAGYYRNVNDARCDLLMADEESLQHNIFSLSTALLPEHSKKFYFVRYQDLISDPKQSLDAIYNFLEIDNFSHHFDNLRWERMPNEENVFGIKNMHSIKPSLKPSKTDVSILSEYVKNKYGNTLDFLAPVLKV
jgi:hypothetical protein